jgi:integrase
MGTVKFNLTNVTDSNALIRAVYRYGVPTKRLAYSTRQSVVPKFWDTEKERVKRSSGFESINKELNDVENAISKIHSNFIHNDNEKSLTLEVFRKHLDEELKRVEKQFKDTTFFAFIEDFIANRKDNPEFAKLSIVKYKQVYTHLQNFAKAKRRKIDFDNIDLSFFDDFTKYLYSKNYAQNYCEKLISTMKVFLNDATERGYNSNTAYKSKKFSVSKEDVNNIYLTESELETMYRLDLSKDPRLERVRDLFIIGSYTGLRFSDLSTFNSDNITQRGDNELLLIKTQKTGKNVAIPLHPFVKSILTKYEGTPPKALTNQKMNQYLKDVAKLSDLEEIVFKSNTKGGKRVDVKHEKWELVTTHTARRSFATNAFKRGIPSISIMRITGHSTEKAFMKYIKIDNEENAILMYESDFFKGISEPHPLKKVS